MVVIVSKQAYLICEAINYIVIDETDEDESDWDGSSSRKKKRPTATTRRQKEYIRKHKPYIVRINFLSATKGNQQNANSLRNGGGDADQVNIRVHGLDNTINLYAEIVEQLREQMPDVLYLDKLVEKFLTAKAKTTNED